MKTKVDISKKNGFKTIIGYGTTVEKGLHFLEYVLCINNHTMSHGSSFLIWQLALATGNRAKRDSKITSVARTIDVLQKMQEKYNLT